MAATGRAQAAVVPEPLVEAVKVTPVATPLAPGIHAPTGLKAKATRTKRLLTSPPAAAATDTAATRDRGDRLQIPSSRLEKRKPGGRFAATATAIAAC